MLKYLCLTHDDLDGIGCRIIYDLAHQHLKKDVDYKIINCSNNSVDDDTKEAMNSGQIDTDTEITFADICASREVLEEMKNKGYEVRIFDHHRTNFPAQQVFPDAQIVPENELGIMQSGTSLLYQYFSQLPEGDKRNTYFSSKGNQNLISKFVDTVRSYDTYEWKETDNQLAKELQTLFFLLGAERFCTRYLETLMNENSGDSLIDPKDMDFVSAKIEMEQNIIDNFTPDDVYQCTVRGRNAALVLSTKGASISELGYQFLSKYPEFDIMVGCSLYRNGEFSFRTVRDDIDLGAEIATPIGGGGHPKAAGAPFPDDVNMRFIDMLLDTLNS